VGQFELMKNLKVDIVMWLVAFHSCSCDLFFVDKLEGGRDFSYSFLY